MRARSTIPLSLAVASMAIAGPAAAEPLAPPAPAPIVATDDPTTALEADATEPAREREMSPLAWTLAGAGAIALGTSAFLTVTALSDGERCERDTMCQVTEMNAISDRLMTADVLAGAGLVSLAGSAVLYYTSARERAKPAISVKPRQGGAVVLVGGSF